MTCSISVFLGHTQSCSAWSCSSLLPWPWKGLWAPSKLHISLQTLSISELCQSQKPLSKQQRSDHTVHAELSPHSSLGRMVLQGLQPQVPKNYRYRALGPSLKQKPMIYKKWNRGKQDMGLLSGFVFFFFCKSSRPVQRKHPSGLIRAATAKENKGNSNHFQEIRKITSFNLQRRADSCKGFGCCVFELPFPQSQLPSTRFLQQHRLASKEERGEKWKRALLLQMGFKWKDRACPLGGMGPSWCCWGLTSSTAALLWCHSSILLPF